MQFKARLSSRLASILLTLFTSFVALVPSVSPQVVHQGDEVVSTPSGTVTVKFLADAVTVTATQLALVRNRLVSNLQSQKMKDLIAKYRSLGAANQILVVKVGNGDKAVGAGKAVASRPGVIYIDLGDLFKIKQDLNGAFDGGTNAQKEAVANNFLGETLAHELAHLALRKFERPNAPRAGSGHDDLRNRKGVITLTNEVLTDLGLTPTRLQDKDCQGGRAAWNNGVKLKRDFPIGGGSWNNLAEECLVTDPAPVDEPDVVVSGPAPSVPSIGSLGALALLTLVTLRGIFLLRSRSRKVA